MNLSNLSETVLIYFKEDIVLIKLTKMRQYLFIFKIDSLSYYNLDTLIWWEVIKHSYTVIDHKYTLLI